ncbi:DUF6361 family protein [Arthrobacter sp. LAPM80]|uniref:DUF6361 family protein n=1 Tax=Arthrobacter sp. LAPM80 TaxID=3141788 RepID=UPI00398B96D0
MTSLISWLDASSAETNRMRELVRLFEMPESVDDLALGQFHDTISNSLFPGTSVLHVAARYLLLIPWCFQSASGMKGADQLKVSAEQAERRLIRRFQELNVERFIGRSAGDRVAQLPSAAYWSALRSWGIVRNDVERNAIGDAMLDAAAAVRDGLPQEPVWHVGLPPAPVGFPTTADRGIALSHGEAEWIRDRVLSAVPGTLIAQLVAKPRRILKTGSVPWADPAAQAATGEAAVWLKHAEAYSALQHGLDAVYAYSVTAQARRRFGEEPEETDAETLAKWREDENYQRLLRDWDVQEFVSHARAVNPRIQPRSIAFLVGSIDELRSGDDPVTNEALHRMVREREKRAKGANSRFINERRLRAWTSPERISPQTFRWIQVRNMIVDLKEGLTRA